MMKTRCDVSRQVFASEGYPLLDSRNDDFAGGSVRLRLHPHLFLTAARQLQIFTDSY